MRPPWGSAWVGLLWAEASVSMNNPGCAAHFIRLCLAH